MFRSRIWEALQDAERRANSGAVSIEELWPRSDDDDDGWQTRPVGTRGALLARASAVADALSPLVSPPLLPAATRDHTAAPPLVPLLLPRSAGYVVAALAALAAGAAFLPLEYSRAGEENEDAASLSAQRAVAAARDAGARVLVVPDGGAVARSVLVVAAATFGPESPQALHVVSIGDLLGARASGQEKAPPPPQAGVSPPPLPLLPLLLPYFCVMPTSGSTSASKMVRLTEEALLRRCKWALEGPQEEEEAKQQPTPSPSQADPHPPSPPLLRAGDAVAFTTSPAFVDHLAQQMFAPLLFVGDESVGARLGPLRLVIVREEQEEEDDDDDNEEGQAGAARPPPPPPLLARPRALLAALEGARATYFVTVPSVLAGLAAFASSSSSAAAPAPALRCVVSSGEPLLASLAEALLLRVLPGARLLNLYGSTETSGDCAWLDVGWWLRQRRRRAGAPAGEDEEEEEEEAGEAAAVVVPAGVPLDADVSLRLRGPGAGGGGGGGGGEVLVGGWCVAAGYHRRAEDDDDDPASAAFWTEEQQAGRRRRWFATGDRGRWLRGGGGGLGRRPAAAPLLHVEGRADEGGGGGGTAPSSLTKAHGARVDCAAVEAALSGAGAGPVAVRAWPAPVDAIVAYVEAGGGVVNGGLGQPEGASPPPPLRPLSPGNPLRRALERAADAALLPPRARPAAYFAIPALPRSAAGKLLRAALPGPPLPPPPPPRFAAPGEAFSEGRVLLALRAALQAVGGPGAASDPAPLEPAEDALGRAGAGGAASRVAVAAAAALGVPAPLVWAFPSARLLSRALLARADGGGGGGSGGRQSVLARAPPAGPEATPKRKRAWRKDGREDGAAAAAAVVAADEAWSVPLDMCVDAAPVATAADAERGEDARETAVVVAAASHGGELACCALLGGASARPTVRRLRLPGSLDAGLVAVGRTLVAVVCRGRGGGGAEDGGGSSLHLAPLLPPPASAAGVSSPPPARMPPPLTLPAHVSSPPAAFSRDQGGCGGGKGTNLLFLATHAPNPRLVIVRVREAPPPTTANADANANADADAAACPSPSWRMVAAAPLPAPSTATPLVVAGGGGGGGGESPSPLVVVAMLDGGLACFSVRCCPPAGDEAEDEDEEGEGARVRELWRSGGASSGGAGGAGAPSSPIFGAPVVLLPSSGAEKASPLALVAHVDGRVRAVCLRDGAAVWEAELSPARVLRPTQPPPRTPLLFARLAFLAPSAMVVAATEDGVLHGLDGDNGRVLWRLALPGGGGLCSPAVVADVCASGGGRGGRRRAAVGLVVAAHDGRVFGVRVEGTLATIVSEQLVPAPVYGAPVVVAAAAEEGEGGGGEAGGGAPRSALVAVVAVGCRDDCVRAVRVRV